jgi:hypothetical protein
MGDQFAAEVSRNAQSPVRASLRRCGACKGEQDSREPVGRSVHDRVPSMAEVAPGFVDMLLDPTARLSSGPGLGHSISRMPVMPPATVARGADSQREADSIAEKLMAMQASRDVGGTSPGVQRYAGLHSSETLERYYPRVQKPAAVRQEAERGLIGQAERLPYLDAIQRSFGHHSLDGVHAHIDGSAARASQAIGALAYTVGNDVAFRMAPDLHIAAHEAAHVIQQRGGVNLNGGIGHAGDRHEQNAECVAKEVVWGHSSEALLDGYERSGAPERAVQRLDQPIVAPAPTRAISIRDFITLVEAEETRWPAAEQIQTSLMITRLRKIFYGTAGWDDYLIPGAKGIASGYNINEVETGRENLSLPGWDADIVRKRQVVKDSSGASPAIASQQEVRLEDGTFDDMGHVFAGLDAANNPNVSMPLRAANITDNKAAVTWIGDLGSAVTEIVFKRFNMGGAVSNSDMQSIVNEYASAQDMLGNIDAYVIASQYNISNVSGKKVSELLRAYYLGAASTSDGRAREHRYSRFCALTGLTGWTGSGFANEADWLNRWTPEVAGAAALYLGANTSGVLSKPGLLGAATGIANSTGPSSISRRLLQNSLEALKIRVVAEPP